MTITKETLTVKDIPINIFYQKDALNRSLIFFVHGYFNDKEQGSTLAKVLARKGFVVICLDAYMHGERLDKRLLNQRDDEDLVMMFEIVQRTGKDIDVLIDYFKTDERINIERIGLTGLSMGGFVTFYELMKQEKIKVAVTIIALPTFYDFWRDYVNNYQDILIRQLLLKKDTTRFREHLLTIDPMNHIDDINPIPILMLNGLKDENVPPTYVQNFYDSLIKKYEVKEHLKLRLHDVSHEWDSKMFNEVVSWFVKYL